MVENKEKVIKNKKQNKIIKGGYVFWSISMGTLLLLIVIFLLISNSPVPVLKYDDSKNVLNVEDSLQIDFEWPVARELEVSISPDVYGEVLYSNMVLDDRLAKTVTFKPELTWLPGTTYEITISNVKSALPSYKKAEEYKLSFITEDLPSVIEVAAKQDGEIRPDNTWVVYLTNANDNLANFDFIFEPSVEAEIILSDDKKSYTITPLSLLSQGQEYSLDVSSKIIRNYFGTDEIAFQSEAESVHQETWQVRPAPGIESFAPQGDQVVATDTMSIIFDENIDFDSFKENVNIEPELVGTWQTNDFKTITYNKSSIVKDTTYTVTVAAGMKTYEGGFLEEDAIYNFTTLGPVRLSSSSPVTNSQGISIDSAIRFSFDQTIDHVSTEAKFSITPEVAGSFSWDGDTMIFDPTDSLSFSTTYTAKIEAGVISVSGFNSEEELSTSFSTELSVTKLAVQYNRQDRNLSCEVATLVMALSYYGVNVPEQPLIDAIGLDGTLHKEGGVWGNPHIAFVGDIDGRQISTGYGVYWEPIARAGNAYRPSTAFSGWNITQVTEEIKKGHPVIVWGTAGSGARVDWKTSDGDNVVAIMGEHTFVAIGFVGPSNNPTKMILLDPLSGERYFTRSSFEWMWGLLGNSGVVVE